MPGTAKRFLTAEWRSLLMLNYPVDPTVLKPFVPEGMEVDLWNGRTFVSMVGFLFLRTRVLGVPIPGHRDFEEINLRFYVRRQAPEGWRRGVVFIKEIVPRWMVACVARNVYGENYVTRPMRSEVSHSGVKYEWKSRGVWNRLEASLRGEPRVPAIDSEESFITEHYWGYTRQRDGGTIEYEVAHPSWRVWQTGTVVADVNWAAEYGDTFVPFLNGKPTSAFVAEGSPIVVRRGRRIVDRSDAP